MKLLGRREKGRPQYDTEKHAQNPADSLSLQQNVINGIALHKDQAQGQAQRSLASFTRTVSAMNCNSLNKHFLWK